MDHGSQILHIVVVKNIYCTKVSKTHEPRTMDQDPIVTTIRITKYAEYFIKAKGSAACG